MFQIRGALVREMECWSMGVLEYWVLNTSLHCSITPVLQAPTKLERGGWRNPSTVIRAGPSTVLRAG